MVRPISVKGTAISTVVTIAVRNPVAVTLASVATAAMITTGVREANVITIPARMRPTKRGPGLAGRVRAYASQGSDRSWDTPTPYWTMFVVRTATVLMDAGA